MSPRRRYDPYWLLAPSALLLLIFFYFPLGFAAYQSFFSWDLLTPPRFVGVANYAHLISSGELFATALRTLLFSLMVVSASMTLGLGLAVLLHRPGKLAAFVRSAVFSAYVISWVSVALLFMWILDADLGLVNRGLGALGFSTPSWLGNPRLALFTLALVTIWKITGYSMVIFIAGLGDIPRALLEAAALDGATGPKRFWAITWPLLRPTAAFVGTTSLIASFQVFDIVRVMTQGGPVRATTVFVYAIYEQIFMNLRVGRASAEVVVFFLFLLGLTALQFRAWRARGVTR
jgi:sn-glycerol 3-phosphate transport system permease protein